MPYLQCDTGRQQQTKCNWSIDPDQLYDMAEEEPTTKPSHCSIASDKSDELLVTEEVVESLNVAPSGKINVTSDASHMLYGNVDTMEHVADVSERKHTTPGEQFCADDVGRRVKIQGYPCSGTLAFFGPHAKQPGLRAGVILDEPVGRNNGTIEGVKYFTCDTNCGVLCIPSKVTFIDE